jgi:hypothetical protein
MDRILAGLVAVTGLLALVAQYEANPAGLPPLPRIWAMTGYFTVLTNALAVGTLLFRAAGGDIGPRWGLALTTAMVGVGIVYHWLLAGLWAPVGLAWWADQGLHSAMPVLWALWWLGFGDKRPGWGAVPFSLVWPVIYCAAALVRGGLTGFWPYPFLDGAALSAGQIAANIAGLTFGFAALAAALVLLARQINRQINPQINRQINR